jgi:superfamily II DNA or RNA helicase
MPTARLSFDRGTLRVDGNVEALGDFTTFDERTRFHRAPAFRYRDLLGVACQRGVELDDRLERTWRRLRAPCPPPLLRPYQDQALAAFETFGARGIIALPTGSGKTRIACAAMARSGESTLVLVPTRVLLDQWQNTLRSHFGDPIGAFGDGMKRLARITVMTFESGYRCLDRFGDHFGMVVVDEAHHFAGGLRAETLEMCPAPVRLGLTATPPTPGSPGADRLCELIGPVVFELDIADLAGRDLAGLEIVPIHVGLTAEERLRYERDIGPFAALRREILRTNPDADFVTCVHAIARMPGGDDVLAGMHRASALSAFLAPNSEPSRSSWPGTGLIARSSSRPPPPTRMPSPSKC